MFRINETKRATLPSIVKYLLPSDTAFLSFRSMLEQRQKMNKTKESFSFKSCSLCPDDFMDAQRISPGGFASEVLPRRFAPEVLHRRFLLGGLFMKILSWTFFPKGLSPKLPQRFGLEGARVFSLETLPRGSWRFCLKILTRGFALVVFP